MIPEHQDFFSHLYHNLKIRAKAIPRENLTVQIKRPLSSLLLLSKKILQVPFAPLVGSSLMQIGGQEHC